MEDPERSYHAAHRVSEKDIFDNRLIFGDNLLALKALEAEFTGKIKCIYIDPPYNTGSAFTHYDDGVEHSIWLSLMRDRLVLLRSLLTEDGSLWISIDDNEAHYYKVGANHQEYQPDFVAETDSAFFMLECKASNEMESPEVLAKRDAAVLWCARASDHTATCGGKPWAYLLIPDDVIAENITLGGLAARYAVSFPRNSG